MLVSKHPAKKLSGVEVLWIFVGFPFTTLIPFRWTCAQDLESCRRCADLREIDTLRYGPDVVFFFFVDTLIIFASFVSSRPRVSMGSGPGSS